MMHGDREGTVLASSNDPLLTALLLGVALAASPFGIIGSIALLGTGRPLANGSAFAAGWFLAIVAIGVLAASMVDPNGSGSSVRSLGFSIVETLLGAVLLAVALRRWHARGTTGTPEEPTWMRHLERVSPVLAFALGAFLPTYGLIFPVVAAIEGAQTSKGAALAMFLVFAIVGSLGVLVPVVVYARRPEESAERLASWRAWLLANDALVVAVIVGILGLLMVAHGLAGIAGSL